MKKIININFHSRVVPIEETAYEILQQYIESLRRYFANEEGKEEIISDIENRFSELFSETLKKGATCITDADVNAIIASMGRPEDFEQEEMTGNGNSASTAGGAGFTGTGATSGAGGAGGAGYQQSSGAQQGSYQYSGQESRRLYRSENDKILGGVCGGLANFLGLDPAIVRIIFVLLTLLGWGSGVLLYIILWIILPYRTLPMNIRKRLYRNPDDRVIGGVASGLAAYFHIEVWIPRLIFALPLLLSLVTTIFRNAWFPFEGPAFFTGGFGGTLFITYIILWCVLPEAVTASEKLEMRGEKVDLESIKNTIKSDLEGFKGKAKEMGSEMQERFQQVGQQVRQSTQSFASEAAPIARKTGNSVGHAIGVLFKVFFLFIGGIICFALITALIGLAVRGDGVLTLKGYILSGFWQNLLGWAGFFLFFVVPVIALFTWLIRRITGMRSRNHYLGYIFGTLWVIGLFCLIALAGMVIRDFRSLQHVEEDVRMIQPSHNKLVITAYEGTHRNIDNGWWFDGEWRDNGFFSTLSDDSLLLNTVKVSLLKSADSNYHVQVLKFSRGANSHAASDLANQVSFPIRQEDSVLYLPDGFTIPRGQQFRNQQVLVAVAIPVGKRVLVNEKIERYRWFSVKVKRGHIRWNKDWDNDWNDASDGEDFLKNSYSWTENVEYVMTTNGLERTGRRAGLRNGNDNEYDADEEMYKEHKSPEKKEQQEKPERPERPEGGGYRYHPQPQSAPATRPQLDTVHGKRTAMENRMNPANTHLYLLTALLFY